MKSQGEPTIYLVRYRHRRTRRICWAGWLDITQRFEQVVFAEPWQGKQWLLRRLAGMGMSYTIITWQRTFESYQVKYLFDHYRQQHHE